MAYTFKHGDRPLDDYVVQRGVGRGGFGEVYYAISDGGREVGLKYLRDNPAIELRGVSHCINLKSPHLVTIFDVKKNADGEYFIVMEYVAGPSLRDLLIAEPNGLGPQKAAFFVRELAKGLGYLHDRGIVHRDMKPGNIFYEDGYVKIGDYGLSKFISVSRHSAQTTSIGTVHYMAPEVGSGNYSRGIDIYAVGVILYEMLLGRVPFEGSSMGEVLMKHLTEQPEVDHLPQPFARVIRKALAKDPNDRYQSMDEMVDELLGVEDVKNSLAGFSLQDLSAAKRVAQDAPSPVPSPNRLQRLDDRLAGVPVVPAGAQPPLPHRLAARSNRLRKKIERKMDKLDARAGKRRGTRRREERAARAQGICGGPRLVAAPSGDRRQLLQRSIMSGAMAIAVACGVGLLAAHNAHNGLFFVSSATLTLGLSGGLFGARKIGAWMRADTMPSWGPRLIMAGCCLPLMGLTMIPLFATEGEQAVLVLAGLLIALLVIDWEKRWHESELSFGWAFLAGLFAAIMCSILADDKFALMGGGVMAATSLSVQAMSWLFMPVSTVAAKSKADVADASAKANAAIPPMPETQQPEPDHRSWEPVPEPPAPPDADPRRLPLGIPVEHGSTYGVQRASVHPVPPRRSAFLRVFWSIVAFALIGGMTASFVMALIGDRRVRVLVKRPSDHGQIDLDVDIWSHSFADRIRAADLGALVNSHQGFRASVALDDLRLYIRKTDGHIGDHIVRKEVLASLVRDARHARASLREELQCTITVCAACFAFLIFALQKTTRRRRVGFWRNTLRPFLIAGAMTGMGAAVSFIAVQGPDGGELAAAIVALVMSSLGFSILLALPGSRRSRPFLVGQYSNTWQSPDGAVFAHVEAGAGAPSRDNVE